MKAVELVAIHLEADLDSPILVLREADDPHRLLPLVIGGNEAAAIALALSGTTLPRPLTHDLMASVVDTLGAEVERIEVTGLEESSFLAELVLRGPTGDRRLDSRPSDAIALAVRTHSPLFVSDDVLDVAGMLENTGEDQLDEGEIDAAVAEFRDALASVEPTHFVEPEPPSDDEPDEGSGEA